MSTSSPGAPTKSGNVLIWVGLATIVLGLILAGLSIVRMIGAIGIGESLGSPVIEAPVTVVDYYEPETYFVYQAIDGSERIAASQVQVSGADGDLEVTSPRYQATIDDGEVQMEAVAAFTVTNAGEYSVTVSPGESTLVRIGPALAAGVGSALAWGAGIGVGGLMTLVGFALLALGLFRRYAGKSVTVSAGAPPVVDLNPAPAAPTTPAASPAAVTPAHAAATTSAPTGPASLPPPGWYPDPVVGGTQRYWDGRAWTEHHT